MSELPLLLYFIASLVIVILTVSIHLSTKRGSLAMESGRKILHFSVIMVCAYVIWQSEVRSLLAGIFFGAAVLLFLITQRDLLLPDERRSYGIALFPVAFGILMLSPLSKSAVVFGVLTLGISDALAGYLGHRYAKRKVLFLAEYKSWLGFGVFYASTLLIGYFFLGATPTLFLLALVPALVELFSYRGSDNLAVPIVAAAWFAFLQNYLFSLGVLAFLGILALFGYFALYKKWLTEAGAAAAALLAVVIITLTSPLYLVPLFVFFGIGSLSSKLSSKAKEKAGRNAIQVFANGLVPTLCVCGYATTGAQVYVIAYFAAVCIHFADTISSDVGTYYGQKTYDILTFRVTPVGLSGGVSVAGTLAGVLAAVGFAFLMRPIFWISTAYVLHIAVLGIAGMLLDSVLGSRFQAKYDYLGVEIERPSEGAHLVKGFSWLQNDLVNLLSSAVLVVVYLWFWA
jgi:uncharacterized protein (TIGR00297 family)